MTGRGFSSLANYMDEGPAATWAGAWCTKELNKSLQDMTKFSWRSFVYALKDAYAPINITGDAQARLRQLTKVLPSPASSLLFGHILWLRPDMGL